MREVLFVCTGNTCRSPMAQYIFNKMAFEHDLPAHAFSRGLAAVEGQPISSHAAAALREVGIDGGEHRAKELTQDDIDNADVIFALGDSHFINLHNNPTTAAKLHLLGTGIADPFGGDMALYRQTREEITRAIERVFESPNDYGIN